MKKSQTRFMPICLNLDGKECLVVGGGKVAWRKITVLRKFGARITCLSPVFIKDLERLGAGKGVRCVKQPYPGRISLKKYLLVIAATDDPRVNKRVARAAGRDKTLVNVVDKSAPGSFIMPAILKQKGLTIGVSTGGISPRRAKEIRDCLRHAF